MEVIVKLVRQVNVNETQIGLMPERVTRYHFHQEKVMGEIISQIKGFALHICVLEESF